MQLRQRLVVEGMGALRLKAHQGLEAFAVTPRRFAAQDVVRLHVELLQLVHRQVDAATARVFAHVANDVGQLHRLAQAMRIGQSRRLAAAEDVARHLTHHTGHEMAITLE